MRQAFPAAVSRRDSEGVGARLGIDLGGTAIKWALVGSDGEWEQGSLPTPTTGEAAVYAAVGEIAAAHPAAATGLAVPGPVGNAEADLLFVPNLHGSYSRRRFVETVAERSGTAPRLMNDAHAHLLAELRLGVAKGVDDVLLITLGTGVGGAVALGGRLHRGALGRAGEIGHMVVEPGGRPCECGDRGCLETEASVTAILAAAGGPEGGLATVIAAARQADGSERRAVEQAGEALGRAISAASAVLAPQLVVIGGGGAAAFDLLEPRARAVVEQRSALLPPCPIAAAALGEKSGALGAALWATEAVAA